jgi:hypothetical protein
MANAEAPSYLPQISWLRKFSEADKLDFLSEIEGVFKSYHRDSGRRLNTEAKLFMAATAAIERSDLKSVTLPRDLWPLVGFEDDIPNLFKLSQDELEQLRERMIEAAQFLMEDAEVLGQTKGGPTRNDSIYAVVRNLASIYSRHTCREVTHSISPIDGSATSDFDKFVLAAYRDFAPEDWTPPQRAITDAISDAIKVDNLAFADNWEKVKGPGKSEE